MIKIFKSKRDSENVLIKKLIEGHPLSFEHVDEEYHIIMLSVARAIVGESIAGEAVQEAWLSAIKALLKFERRSTLKTWLLQIVSNGAKTRVRRETRYIHLDDENDSSSQHHFNQCGHRTHSLNQWNDNTTEALLAN